MIDAKQIRAARGLLNWTQKDLALASDLSPTTIRNLESGEMSPRGATIDIIRRAFEDKGLEFIVNGVRLGDDLITRLPGPHGAEALFDDIAQTMREKGGEVVCAFRSLALAQLVCSLPEGDFERLNQLGEAEPVRCLVGGLPEFPPISPAFQLRTAANPDIGAWPFFIYGNKHANIMLEGRASYNIVIFESAGMALHLKKYFLAAWETALPCRSVAVDFQDSKRPTTTR